MNVFKKLTVASAIASTVLLSACGSGDEPEPRELDNGSSESETVETQALEVFGDLDEDDPPTGSLLQRVLTCVQETTASTSLARMAVR